MACEFLSSKKFIFLKGGLSILTSVLLLILNLISFIKFQTIKYKNYGNYFFKDGVDVSSLNFKINECSRFSESGIYYLNRLLDNEINIFTSLQFWASVVILFDLDIIQLINDYRFLKDKQFIQKESLMKYLRHFTKLLFIPGVFFIASFDHSKDCMVLKIDYFLLEMIVNLTDYLPKIYIVVAVNVLIEILFQLCSSLEKKICGCKCCFKLVD